MKQTLICSWCGKTFTAERKRKFCSAECRLVTYGRKDRNEKNKASFGSEIARINELARAEGLTYGQYISKHREA